MVPNVTSLAMILFEKLCTHSSLKKYPHISLQQNRQEKCSSNNKISTIIKPDPLFRQILVLEHSCVISIFISNLCIIEGDCGPTDTHHNKGIYPINKFP